MEPSTFSHRPQALIVASLGLGQIALLWVLLLPAGRPGSGDRERAFAAARVGFRTSLHRAPVVGVQCDANRALDRCARRQGGVDERQPPRVFCRSPSMAPPTTATSQRCWRRPPGSSRPRAGAVRPHSRSFGVPRDHRLVRRLPLHVRRDFWLGPPATNPN